MTKWLGDFLMPVLNFKSSPPIFNLTINKLSNRLKRLGEPSVSHFAPSLAATLAILSMPKVNFQYVPSKGLLVYPSFLNRKSASLKPSSGRPRSGQKGSTFSKSWTIASSRSKPSFVGCPSRSGGYPICAWYGFNVFNV